MKRERFILLTVTSLFFGFSSAVLAQVSFFQTPTYSGSGGQVFVADFNGDGKPDILTSDGTLNLGNGNGTFNPGTSVSGTPLAVADFNGDGKVDVLEQGTGTLLVLLGNGDGTFQAPTSTTSNANLNPVAAIDLTGSGRVDVVGVFNSNLLIYMGKGDGTFASGVPYSLGAAPANTPLLSFGDFNGDGKIDIVVSTPDPNPAGNPALAGQEIAFLGNGDGTFQTPKISTGLVAPVSAVAGDFNGDGKLDLALGSTAVCSPAPNCSSVNETYLLLGNGDGTFQAATGIIPASGWLAAADVNGDSKLDLVVGSFSGMAQTYLGNGDGTFSNASNYVGGGLPVSADFNLDGKLDIAENNSVLLGNGNGTFRGIPLGIVVPESQSGNLGPAVVGAFEKKGVNDVGLLWWSGSGTTVSYYVSILHNDGTGALSLVHTYSLQQQGYAIVTADFNGDGNLDLAVLGEDFNSQIWSVSVLLGNGDGSFQSPLFYSESGTLSASQAITVADFNNDHKPDLAIGLANSTMAIMLGNGDGSFSTPADIYSVGSASAVLCADFNGDGNADIAFGYSDPITQESGTALLLGNGDGTFHAPVIPTNLNGFFPQLIADFNLDGKPDLFGGNSQVALGNGDGTFTLLPLVPSPDPLHVDEYGFEAIADFNGDSIPDLLGTTTFNSSPDYPFIVLGNGDGTFGSAVKVPKVVFPAIGATDIAVDMNGDGLADIVFPWTNSALGVLINTTSAVAPGLSFRVSASGLSPSPAVAGSSASSTIIIGPLYGFTGNVALSCTNPPAGVTCSFSPASISGGSGTSTLRVSTSASMAAGSYTLTVSGVSGNLTRIAALPLIVESGTTPDFQISAAGTSPTTVAAGSSATSTISIASLSGFSSVVALTCNSAVAGVTCSLSPKSVTSSGSTGVTSILTINTTATVAPNAYSVMVTGTSGSDIHSAGVTLTVQPPTPDFSLAPPSGGTTSQTINAGQSASFPLSLAPGNSFSGTVNLSCSIAPGVNPAPTCALSSSSVQISGGGSKPVTVTVATTAPVTSIAWPYPWPLGPLAGMLMLLGSGCLALRSRKRVPVLAPAAMVLALASCLSCAGGSSPHTTGGTPPGTYTATVTASSGSLNHQIALHVVVQ